MRSNRRIFLSLATSAVAASIVRARRVSASPTQSYDLVIYGGSSAGVIAALQARRMGKTVAIVNSYGFLGGMTSSGLNSTDVDNPAAVSGLARSFFADMGRIEKAGERYSPLLRKLLSEELKKCVSGIEYVNARHALQEARSRAAEIFGKDIDLLVLPTWKRLPITLDSLRRLEGLVADELSTLKPFNVLGLPAISVPCGFTRSGLPVGVQIVGRPFAETRVLAFAHAYERITEWHLRKPLLNGSRESAQ